MYTRATKKRNLLHCSWVRKEVKEEEEKFLIRVVARSSCFSALQNPCMHALLHWSSLKFTYKKVHTRLEMHHSLQSARILFIIISCKPWLRILNETFHVCCWCLSVFTRFARELLTLQILMHFDFANEGEQQLHRASYCMTSGSGLLVVGQFVCLEIWELTVRCQKWISHRVQVSHVHDEECWNVNGRMKNCANKFVREYGSS